LYFYRKFCLWNVSISPRKSYITLIDFRGRSSENTRSTHTGITFLFWSIRYSLIKTNMFRTNRNISKLHWEITGLTSTEWIVWEQSKYRNLYRQIYNIHNTYHCVVNSFFLPWSIQYIFNSPTDWKCLMITGNIMSFILKNNRVF